MAGGGFSFVQGIYNNGNSTLATATYPGTPVSGNLLVCGVFSQTSTTISLTNWNALPFVTDSSTYGFRMFWRVCPDQLNASVVASVGSGQWANVIGEYQMPQGSMATPVAAAQTNASSASQPTPTVAIPAGSRSLVVCYSGAKTTLGTVTFSGETIGGITATEREDATGTSRTALCLYDISLPALGGSVAGAATCGQAAVGAGGIAVFTVPPLPPADLVLGSSEATRRASPPVMPWGF